MCMVYVCARAGAEAYTRATTYAWRLDENSGVSSLLLPSRGFA